MALNLTSCADQPLQMSPAEWRIAERVQPDIDREIAAIEAAIAAGELQPMTPDEVAALAWERARP